MSVIREHENHFFIDLRARRVYCRPCGKPCRFLACPGFIHFWCASHHCPNAGDVKLFRNGTWQVFGFQETCHEGLVSEIVPILLHCIETGPKIEVKEP